MYISLAVGLLFTLYFTRLTIFGVVQVIKRRLGLKGYVRNEQTLVNLIHYTIIMVLIFFVYLGFVISAFIVDSELKNFDLYMWVFSTLSTILVSLYLIEMFSGDAVGWMTLLHHLLTAVSVCFLLEFSDNIIEQKLGLMYLGYVLTEVNIYASLVLKGFAQDFGLTRLVKPALYANRFSVYAQIFCSLANQVLCLTFIGLNWDLIDKYYKIIFFTSDPLWLFEQGYCIHRSVLSLRSKIKRMNPEDDINGFEKAVLAITKVCDVFSQCSFKISRRDRPVNRDDPVAAVSTSTSPHEVKRQPESQGLTINNDTDDDSSATGGDYQAPPLETDTMIKRSEKERRKIENEMAEQRAAIVPRPSGWWHYSYIFDWSVTGVVFVLELLIYSFAFAPFTRVLPTNDASVMYPSLPEIFPMWSLGPICVVLPVAVFIVSFFHNQSSHDFHHATLGLLETGTIAGLVTFALKLLAGRFRPDWLAVCAKNTAGVCTGDSFAVRVARMSFPSAHSAFAMAAMAYLTLYASAKLGIFKRNGGQMWKVGLVMVPIALGLVVSISRTIDYHNHFDDVLAGIVIGIFSALIGYFMNYPELSSQLCELPKSRQPLPLNSSLPKHAYELLIDADDV